MLRKMLIPSLLVLLSSTSASANGFYLGAGMGPDYASLKQDSRVLVLPPGARSLDANVKDTRSLSGVGAFGSLFGGYQMSSNKFYIASEINATISNDEFQSENADYVHGSLSKTNYKMYHSYGFSILPGFIVSNDSLFYVRMGYSNANFKIATTDASLSNIDRNLSGFRYGFGVKHSFTQHISARMEYSQALYQRTQFTVVDGAATKTTQITPTTSQVEFGLIYDIT